MRSPGLGSDDCEYLLHNCIRSLGNNPIFTEFSLSAWETILAKILKPHQIEANAMGSILS